jgi:hypothetical protein
VRRLPGWALVAAAIALAVVWFCYWGFSTHIFQNDEDQYVYLSRWLQQDFPSSLFAFDVYGRGLQRLEVWLLAVPSALFDSPWSLQGGRLLNAIAFASTAIPVYRLGRDLGLRSAWAALAAALSIAVPWAIVTTAFLTENVAYPASMWAVWGIFRAAVAPRWWRDLLALLLLVVAGAARSGLLVLAPVLPIVVAATGLRCGSGPFGERARTVAREHVVLWVAVGAGVLALLAGPLGLDSGRGLVRRLAGGYATQAGFEPLALLEKAGRYLARVVVGTGFFAAAAGVPWLTVQLVRSREPARFAFSLLALTATLAILYSLNTAGPDERYVLYLAPFVLLAAAAALSHRELSWAGFAIASVLLALLLLRVPWTERGAFGYFVSPAETIYTHTSMRLDRYLPGDAADLRTLMALALGGAGVALAAIGRLAPGRVSGAPGAVVVAAVALAVPLQAQRAFSAFVNGVGTPPSVSERAFADRKVPRGATVGEFAEGAGQETSFWGIWQEVQFYNERMDTVFALGENRNPWPPGDRLVQGVGFDEQTGRISSPEPLSDYLVVPAEVGAARVRGAVVATPGYVPVALVRVAQPPTLAWSAHGFGQAGAIRDPEGGTVRLYGTGLRPGSHCASFVLAAPPERTASYSLRRGERELAAGQVPAGGSQPVPVVLDGLGGRGHVDVTVSGADVRVAAVSVDQGC